jgi:toxin ParE1/3/4
MLAIHLSYKAKQDLEEIWIYSSKEWGEKKADKYLDDFGSPLEKILLKNPRIGIACNHIKVGYRQYRVNEHLIFYKLIFNKIYIIRVLHKNMKFEKHF